MVHDWKMALYWQLPVALQNLAMTLYGCHLQRLYYGDRYEQYLRQFREWQTWSRKEIQLWQSERLRRVLEVAGTRVQYYRESWRGLDWKAVESPADLWVLPRVEKQALRQNEGAFLVDGLAPRSLWVEKTSGTTGTSLRVYWPYEMLPKWWALVETMVRGVAGVGQHNPRAMMGGRPIVPGSASRPPYWRFNRRWQQLYLSSYHVSVNASGSYVAAIRRYGSEWVTGYGSAIAALARSALEAGIAPFSVRAVIVSGDTLLPSMRHSIEAFFQCKCFDHYGQAEGVCMAMECQYGCLHVVWPAGIIEIIREDGSPCGPGEVGEIVATGLLNDAMPLVRYRLGDYAAWGENQQCACGNPSPILSNLEGRLDDYLVTSDGRKIGRLSTALKRSPTIHSAQLVQDRLDHGYLLVRPSDSYRRADALAVRDDIQERIGRFDLEIIEVREIPKTPGGKLALVVRLPERPQMTEVYASLLRR